MGAILTAPEGSVGNVLGPGAAVTDNAIVRMHETSGNRIQGSGVIIDDSDNVSGVTNMSADSVTIAPAGHLRLDAATEYLVGSDNNITVAAIGTFIALVGDVDFTATTITLTGGSSITLESDVTVTGSIGVTTGPVLVGVNDTTAGAIWLRGAGASSAVGGSARFYTAADHDTSIDYFQVRAYNDDLEFTSVTTAKLTYQGGADTWLFAVGITVNGNIAVTGTVDGVDVAAHAARHQNGGADEINVGSLSGLLADAQTPLAHASLHSDGGTDEISVEDLATAGGSGTVPVSQGDGSLAMAAPTPAGHAASHENVGGDEIDVGGLSGLLADAQTPLAHAIPGAHTFSGLTIGHVLRASGASAASFAAIAAGDLPTNIDATNIADGSVTNTEFQQLGTMGASTISGAQWGYVGAMDQSVTTSDTVTFAKLGIGTTVIPHGGNGIAIVAIDGPTASSSGPHLQFTASTGGGDDYPLMQFLNWQHDTIGIVFDAYSEGVAGWKSSDVGSNFNIYKSGDLLRFQYSNGNAQGGTVVWGNSFWIEADGEVMFSPAAALKTYWRDSDTGVYSQSNSNVTMFADGSITLDAPTVTVSDGIFVLGVADTVRGSLTLYGPDTGQSLGGAAYFCTAADHDDSIDYFTIAASSDDLEIRSVTTPKLTYKGGEDRWDFASDVLIAAGNDLDCLTNGAYFKPRRVSQSGIATPDVGELLLSHNSDDSKTYLVYNDSVEGVRSVELA